MDRIEKIEKLIKEFLSTRIEVYRGFEEDEQEHRRIGIYRYKRGSELMNFLYSMVCNINEKLWVSNLMPQTHSSPKRLIEFIKNFRDYIRKNQELIDINRDEELDHTLGNLQEMSNELVDFFDYIIEVYDSEEISVPYKELRSALAAKDVDIFIEKLNSILASVSYAIAKQKEGYLHSNIHVILKLLGFDIQSEETTNIGRIDAVIRFTNVVYVFEFKNGTREEAMAQIEEKKYYEKFIIDNKEIIGVGVGFDERGIKEFEVKQFK